MTFPHRLFHKDTHDEEKIYGLMVFGLTAMFAGGFLLGVVAVSILIYGSNNSNWGDFPLMLSVALIIIIGVIAIEEALHFAWGKRGVVFIEKEAKV